MLPIGFLISCSEDEEVTQQEATAPELPPAAVFAVDFPGFDGEADNGRSQEEGYDNAIHAFLNYRGWQTALELHLAHPAIAFGAAVNQEPRYLADEDRWVWVLETDFLGKTYQVDLYGQKVDDRSVWEMYVSQEDGFQDALWLEGYSALDGSGGAWAVRTNTKNPKNALSIEWKASEGAIPYAKYTGLDAASDVYRNYIEYGSRTEGDFSVFYNIFDSSEDNLLKIEHNRETKVGRVSDPARFGNQDWYCWNSDYQNVSCE